MITQKTAKQIVDEITKVIPQKINIINPNGIIIASSNPDRIGQLHTGALTLIKNNLEELIIHSEEEYEGAKAGTNFPITARNKIVGVIGITGDYDEILPYAQIIKRMTQILVLEGMQLQEQESMDIIRNRYLYEWLHNDFGESMEKFIARGNVIGIDITRPRRLAVIDMIPEEKNKPEVKDLKKIAEAEKYLKRLLLNFDKDNLYLMENTYIILGMTEITDKKVKELIGNIKDLIQIKFPVMLRAGVDGGLQEYKDMNRSYVQARKAWKASKRNAVPQIRFYHEINMEIFIDEIPDATKREYILKLFEGFTKEEFIEAVDILNAYYNSEGSITKASENLFIHKNTLQKKLLKIYERTGFDPRSIKYSSLFFNAVYFYNDIK